MWKNSFELIDFHSHILPCVDDGAKDLSESLKMLSLLSEEGIDTVVSTSHFYSEQEDVASFLERRDRSFEVLCREVQNSDKSFPKLVLGAEVRVFPEMHKCTCLSGLCIGSSRHILLEMPYDKWSDWMYREIYALSSKGFIPIMAHVERYIGAQSVKDIENNLLSLGVLIQANSSFVYTRKEKKFVKSLIESNRLFALGSDCHNTDTRPPELNDAFRYISKKHGDEKLRFIMENARKIL